MDKPNRKIKITVKSGKAFIDGKEIKGGIKVAKVGITKKEFEGILTKVFVPSSGKLRASDQARKRTSESHPSDGYIGTNT